MKNIIKVNRFNDNASRFYALPENVTLPAGTLVTVEMRGAHSTTVGITVSATYAAEGAIADMIKDLYHISDYNWDNMMRVISVYTENKVDWPSDEADEAEESSETEESEEAE